MRKPNVFGHTKALPRMSWSPHNLFNLYQRTVGQKATEAQFTRTSLTLFQQRWISKRLLRAYHGDHIPEKSFKKWYLPRSIPDVRPRKLPRTLAGAGVGSNDEVLLDEHRGAMRNARMERKRRNENDEQGLAPVGSLMLSEIERRMDVFIFRCCFAHSVYEARRLVVHGYVKLNGKKHTNANTRIAPGDMVSVDPSAIRFLRPLPKQVNSKPATKEPEAAKETETGSEPSDSPESESTASAPTPNAFRSSPPPALSSGSTTTPSLRSAAIPYSSTLTPFNLPAYASPFLFIPAYIEVSFATCSAIYVRHPTARPGYSEIPTPYEADGEVMRLGWEWYAKRRPRIRSMKKLMGGPENRVESDAVI